MTPVDLGRFLVFWPKKISQVHLVYPCPRSGISHFSKEPWFLIVGNNIERPLSGYKGVHCYGVTVVSTPECTKLGNTCFFFWPRGTVCGILVPWPGMEPSPPAMAAWSPNHWTTREVPICAFRKRKIFYKLYYFQFKSTNTGFLLSFLFLNFWILFYLFFYTAGSYFYLAF